MWKPETGEWKAESAQKSLESCLSIEPPKLASADRFKLSPFSDLSFLLPLWLSLSLSPSFSLPLPLTTNNVILWSNKPFRQAARRADPALAPHIN